MEIHIKNSCIVLIQGDITEQDTDAIVNAANSSLMGGGGVDGAIHSKGGVEITEECRKIRQILFPSGLPTGEAVATSGGKLKAKKVIHTVGPVWFGGDRGESEMLSKAYNNSLTLAEEIGLKTVSFPSISTGAYGYPIEKASKIALKTVKEFLEKNSEIKEVRFVLYNKDSFEIYKNTLKNLS